MLRRLAVALLALMLAAGAAARADDPGTRLKELGRFEGWRDNQLVGYGIVTGLAGTGDSPRNKAARQSLANVLGNFDIAITTDQVQSRNVAIVGLSATLIAITTDQVQSRNVAIVGLSATLPPIARVGDKLDITVTSLGDARSLVGGTLLMTTLRGPNNKVYAVAQGPLSVGGYSYDMNGNVVQKNHPTVGRVPGGATVEAAVHADLVDARGAMRFLLAAPDHTTARRVADRIAGAVAGLDVSVQDAGAVVIRPRSLEPDDLETLATEIEGLTVVPDATARVVVNERTGTVVSGGNVRIGSVTIAHGDLKVSISSEPLVSQPAFIGQAGADVRTVVAPRTRVDVDEAEADHVSMPGNSTVADLVLALRRIKTSTRDVIAILQGIKEAGALHAELVIQ
jgi:flagellar P-ring protein precursor FlgI